MAAPKETKHLRFKEFPAVQIQEVDSLLAVQWHTDDSQFSIELGEGVHHASCHPSQSGTCVQCLPNRKAASLLRTQIHKDGCRNKLLPQDFDSS